jgi:hypothetical protein
MSEKTYLSPIHSAGATSASSLLALDCGVMRDNSDEEVHKKVVLTLELEKLGELRELRERLREHFARSSTHRNFDVSNRQFERLENRPQYINIRQFLEYT